ncbi:hypothetical protein PVAG01_09351 [Phlyctema vagabunda]|uniref:Uncharacterized protein n=1 Tax=Phlyctema vagabunda TaxID=108571 RepID=A0ABR4P756_9HELO
MSSTSVLPSLPIQAQTDSDVVMQESNIIQQHASFVCRQKSAITSMRYSPRIRPSSRSRRSATPYTPEVEICCSPLDEDFQGHVVRGRAHYGKLASLYDTSRQVRGEVTDVHERIARHRSQEPAEDLSQSYDLDV